MCSMYIFVGKDREGERGNDLFPLNILFLK